MEKAKFEELIDSLSEIKDEWNEKYDENMEWIKGYEPTTDKEKLADIKEKLNFMWDELNSIGVKYKEKLKYIVTEMDKEANDPIVSKLCEYVISDIDSDYSTYKGNREKRLRDINDIIEMYKRGKKLI